MNSKVCTKCKLEKRLDQFYCATHVKDGRQSVCKDCKARTRTGAKTNEKLNRNIESLPGEIWKDIEGFKEIYQISIFGRVKSLARLVPDPTPITGFRIINPSILKVTYSSTYPTVRLTRNNKSANYRVHLLLWDAFGSEKRDYVRVVDHKNNNKNDFRLENLQLITMRLNTTKDRRHPNLLGAIFLKNTKTWACRIRFQGKKVELGTFKTEIEAHQRYIEVRNQIENNSFVIPERKRKVTPVSLTLF